MTSFWIYFLLAANNSPVIPRQVQRDGGANRNLNKANTALTFPTEN